MNPPVFLSPSWCRALTLSERIALPDADGRDGSEGDFNEELGRKRLQNWQSQPQFATGSVFAQRLALDGIDEEHLLQILGQPDDCLHGRLSQNPAWLAALAEAFSQPASAYVNLQPGEEELGFLELVQPLIDRACDRLFAAVGRLIDKWAMLPFDPQAIEDVLLMNLLDPLLLRLSRTMVLELNVARLQGFLEGDTPLERFISFIERLRRRDESMAILAEYPVLARQLALCIDQWLDGSLEFLGRLCADWPAIRAQFAADEDPGLLLELAGGAGDTHRGGRSVMIARFESGFQIVYKPKSLAIDVHFQELLSWLNGRGCQPALRTLTVFDCGDYGWVEYVENQECQTIAEIRRYYWRLGAYLALLYAINASDFHLENLIASGEHPLLIDLETLFNPEFERFEEEDAYTAAVQTMLQSVLSVGMLPQRLWSAGDYGGIDISGLGGEEGQMSPDRLPQPAAAGTDTMHFERRRVELSGESNRPRLDGVEASALDHVSDVLAGFREMYQLLLHNRADLLASTGPIARFEQDETRVLIRPTRTYDQLLFESFHPDTLRDALERGLLLDRLWVVVPQRAFMSNLIGVEQADLWQGDIPVFTTRPTSLILYSASGAPIADVLTETGMDIARRRIKQLGDLDLSRQEWFIRGSLATLASYEYGTEFQEKAHYRLLQTKNKPTREQFIAAARAAADQLAATAVLGAEDVSWLGLELLAEESWDISPVGMDLYNGLPGIAFFLAYAGAVLNNAHFTALARRAAQSMLQYMELFSQELPGIGAFEGWGGLLYTFTHLGALWQDQTLLSQAEELVDVLARFIEQDEEYSVVGGAAGAIGSLLALHNCRPSPKTLKTATACGDHLLATAQQTEQGLSWVTPRFGPQPLLGFGHGAAGIAWALLELAVASGEERFATAAAQAINYERCFFSAEAQNWPDLRQVERNGAETKPNSPRFPVAWCFGAAGIGLARLQALPHLPDTHLDTEIQAALDTTLARGFGHSHSLCHGDLGNLELLLQADRLSDRQELRPQIEHLSAMILESIARVGWQSGGPGAVELPGLMLGIAGIGYQMLRLAEPALVPSVLLLAPPEIP